MGSILKTGKIVTHNGQAHFDEFLAISLIIARHEDTHFHIERPEIWVIDIGDRFEPPLKNFDHHQDLDLPASFVQVAEYLELKDILKTSPWWDFKDRIDRRGGYRIAEELGMDFIDALSSPVEKFFLGLFSESPLSVYQHMKVFGRQLIDDGYRLKEQIAFWENCEQMMIKNKKVIVGYTYETNGSIQYCERLNDPPAVRINYDGRGDGWSLSTIKDADGIGFIAKTKTRIPLEDVLQLVEQAIL